MIGRLHTRKISKRKTQEIKKRVIDKTVMLRRGRQERERPLKKPIQREKDG